MVRGAGWVVCVRREAEHSRGPASLVVRGSGRQTLPERINT